MSRIETRILVVDDMREMRKLIAHFLRELGYHNIVEAANGEEAFSLLEKPGPPVGLVISDWSMPVCTGIKLLGRIRADARFGALPFVMVTGESLPQQEKAAWNAGASGFLPKPFTRESLHAAVVLAIGNPV